MQRVVRIFEILTDEELRQLAPLQGSRVPAGHAGTGAGSARQQRALTARQGPLRGPVLPAGPGLLQAVIRLDVSQRWPPMACTSA